MTKINVWDLVVKEAATIIAHIEKGEIKGRKECREYLQAVYNWEVSYAIESIVSIYASINNVEFGETFE